MAHESNKRILLEVKGISKSFYGTTVLDDINFDLEYGQVLGLVGRNGAGKSTLVKILTGVYHPDNGQIFIDGSEVEIQDVKIAQQLGISQVFQELSLANNLSVAENIFIGNVPNNRLGLIKRRELYRKTQELLDKFNVKINPKDTVKSLSVCDRQIVEILKAISKNPKLLILDEPTSALEESEIQVLYNFIKELRMNSYSIIYISHHMSEIYRIVDKVMVLLDGRKIGSFPIGDIKIEELVNLIVNENFETFVSDKEFRVNEDERPILEVRNLSFDCYYKNVNFSVHKGEILGIAGLVGSGKFEICKSLFGVYKNVKGDVYLNGEKLKLTHPSDIKRKGIFLLPQNRKIEGLFLNDEVSNNMISTVLQKLTKFGFLQRKKITKIANEYVDELKIKLQSLNQMVRYLSGGNQQKVLVTKSISPNPDLLIALDPTRGIDVGSKADIDRLIYELSQEGMSILMVSSELEELTNMCDRILVMNDGGIVSEFLRHEFNTQDILLAVHQDKNVKDEK